MGLLYGTIFVLPMGASKV
jgi:hypothetical protein